MREIMRGIASIYCKQDKNKNVIFSGWSGLRCALLLSLFPALSMIASCSEKMMPAGVTGYNHMNHFAIATFTVNGAAGKNLNEGSGGGSESCCVSIPEKWRPGLKAKIAWRYDQSQDDKSPLPPSQEVVIEVPEYKRSGRFQVHFYENHKIIVVVSNCSLGHPFYPMGLDDQLPWSPNSSREEARKFQKQEGMNNEC